MAEAVPARRSSARAVGAARPRPAGPALGVAGEYAFLCRGLLDAATLARADSLSRRWQVPLHDVLISLGWVTPGDYARALAGECRTAVVGGEAATLLEPHPSTAGPRQCLAAGLLRQRRRGAPRLAVAATRQPPGSLRQAFRTVPQGSAIALATGRDVRDTVARAFAGRLAAHAVHGLASRHPHECAASGLSRGQHVAVAGLALLLAAGLILDPTTALGILAALATAFFALAVALRLLACAWLVRQRRRDGEASRTAPRLHDADLPVYTILVPLFREAKMLPALAQALARLDWPAAKLDIKFVLEAVDTDTITAAKGLRLPGNVDFIVVPDWGPRTKPKALNYALQFARGDYVTIYDAEDRPEPDQLRKAHAAFLAGPPNLACVQARLAFYNPHENWLTRQFALEYAALFDGLLPTLQRLRLPIPLGGTSNHFRAAALRWLAAWDAFNVTEDADLGIRLARRGYVCRIIDSTTLEEATLTAPAWLRQRSRWLKGFMQTYAVHMRQPRRLWRELGPAGFLGFQIVIGGTVLSALVHPLFYALAVSQLTAGSFLAMPEPLLGAGLWALALFNVACGYAGAMALALLAQHRRGLHLARHVIVMPLYWLLGSRAAYRALRQIVHAPFHWDKTEHGLSRFADPGA